MTTKNMDYITKIFALPGEDSPHKHKLYRRFGKVGTGATTVLWFIDVMPKLNEITYFIDESTGLHPNERNCTIHYLRNDEFRRGVVTNIYENEALHFNGYVQISLG